MATRLGGDRGLTFKRRTGLYRCDWRTKTSWEKTCRAFGLTLDDGTVHRLLVELSRPHHRWSR